MIEIKDLYKSFEGIQAIKGIRAKIPDGHIFGLVGSNGAGKSTLLRLMAGVLKSDQGEVLVDGENIYENSKKKAEVCFLSDTAYFFPNSTIKTMSDYYALMYKDFDREQFFELARRFKMDENRKISTFSKGVKKQVSVLLGVCAKTRYLLCDETFDGLDPVMRQAVKSLFASELLSRPFTPIIASHNLREIEDICDCVGLVHEGGILFTKDIEDMKLHIHKIQCVLSDPADEEKLYAELEVLKYEKQGAILTFVARGNRDEIMRHVKEKNPVFVESVGLSLEEIFISETEVAGYDVKDFFG